jgi:hypothetical protein
MLIRVHAWDALAGLPRACGPLDPHLCLRPRPPCSSKLRCDLQALRLPEFLVPFRYGLVALGVGVVVAVCWRLWRRRSASGNAPPIPFAGPLLCAVALGGYEVTGHLVTGLAVAVALLAAGGLVADVARLPIPVRLLLGVPGAVVLVQKTALPDPTWARVFAGVLAVVGGTLVADLDRRHAATGLGPVLATVTVVGLYESVPDPDFALLIVGAALPLVLLGWPAPLARLGGAGSAGLMGLFAWADAVGGRGRLSAVIAGAACLGLLAVEPVTRLLRRKRGTILDSAPRRWWVPVVVAAVQLALCVAATRISGPTRTPAKAALIAGAAFALAVAVLTISSTIAARFRRPGALETPPAGAS